MRICLIIGAVLLSGALLCQDSFWIGKLRNEGCSFAEKGQFDEAHAAFTESARLAKLGENEWLMAEVTFELAKLHGNARYKGAQPQFIESLLLACAKAAARADHATLELNALSLLDTQLRIQKKPVDEMLVTDVVLSMAISRIWWLSGYPDAADTATTLGLLPRVDEWAAISRSMHAGNTAAASKLALAVIERLEKDKCPRSAACARLWLAQQLCTPAHAGKGGDVSVLKLAQAAAEQFEKTHHWHSEYAARLIVAKAETDLSRAFDQATRARELMWRARQGDSDNVLDVLEVLSRVAPADSRAAWRAELLDVLLRRAQMAQGELLARLRNGQDVLKWWLPFATRLRGYAGLDARLDRAAKEVERLLDRQRALESQPTPAQRAAFRAKVASTKNSKPALAALARMAELSGRHEVIDLLLENLASDTPLVECALALETLARAEDLAALTTLAASPNPLSAGCAAAIIFRLAHGGVSVDVRALLDLPKLDALARIWLLAAQAARGEESAIATLRAFGATAAETGNTALLLLAALGDATSMVELRKRLPPASNAKFYEHNLARVPIKHIHAFMNALGTETLEGARAHWVHRQWRDYTRTRGKIMGARLLYLQRRDRTELLNDTPAIIEDLQAARNEASAEFRDEEAALLDWAVKRAMRDNAERAADFEYVPDSFIGKNNVWTAGEAELDRAPGGAAPAVDGCWLNHTQDKATFKLSLHKRLQDCALADNRITLVVGDLRRRCRYDTKPASLRALAAALDNLYAAAELRIEGHKPLPLAIAFKGYAWRDEERFNKDGTSVPGKITSEVNPERWQNKEYDCTVRFTAELPRGDGGELFPIELLAKALLVVKVKFFDDTDELKFTLSSLSESLAEKPDLVVEHFSTEPANPKPGQVLVARLTAINTGRSVDKAGLCTVRFYVKNPQYDKGFRVVAEQQFDPVGWRAGERKTFTLLPVLCETHFLNAYSHTFVPEAGDVELKVMVDSFDMVEESDNDNNIMGRTLGWKLEGERAATLAEQDLLDAVRPLLERLRAASTSEDCLAISAEIEALFERAQVKTQNTRAALDLCRRVGCALCHDFAVAAVKQELAEAMRNGALNETVLRRLGSRLAIAQRAYVTSGTPLVLTDLDRARRTTLALSRSAKLTNEAFELGNLLGMTPEGAALPAGAETFAGGLDKIDNALSLARWIDDLRRRNQGDATVKPNTKDAVDAVTSLTGLDVLLHVPKTLFKNLIDYGDRAFNHCSKVMELIAMRISGKSSDAEIAAAIEAMKAGMAPAQLGRDIIKDLGVDSLKKVKVIGPIVDFFVTWFEEDERYAFK